MQTFLSGDAKLLPEIITFRTFANVVRSIDKEQTTRAGIWCYSASSDAPL